MFKMVNKEELVLISSFWNPALIILIFMRKSRMPDILLIYGSTTLKSSLQLSKPGIMRFLVKISIKRKGFCPGLRELEEIELMFCWIVITNGFMMTTKLKVWLLVISNLFFLQVWATSVLSNLLFPFLSCFLRISKHWIKNYLEKNPWLLCFPWGIT